MSENRRIRMTKMLIKDALLRVMKNTPFEKISVTQICAEADVNRSTFYAHYADTRQVLNDIESELLEHIPVPPDGDAIYSERVFLDMLTVFFSYIKKNSEMFELLMGAGSDNFSRILIRNVFERYTENKLIADSDLARYGYVFIINGVIGLTVEWIETGFPFSDEQFAKMVLSMSRGAYKCLERECLV